MDKKQQTRILEIVEEAVSIKNEALNRDDPQFQGWHEQARNIVIENAPGKLLTFDEIPFASDYFLSKSQEEREEINDRIALVSDIDEAIRLMEEVAALLEKEAARQKRQERKKVFNIPRPQHSEPGYDAGATPTALIALRRVYEQVDRLNISAHDKETVLGEVARVEKELALRHPDWDVIKRAVKFFLDYDRELALTAIPLILTSYIRNER